MNAKKTIQAIAFAGLALATVLGGCATSVSGSGSSGDISCSGLFSNSGCLSNCNTAAQACSAAGQSSAFNSFLECASNSGFSCSGSQVSINAGSCQNETAAIAACASGMSEADGGGDSGYTNPYPTSTSTSTSTSTTPGLDSGAPKKQDSGSTPPPSGDAGDPCENCATTVQGTTCATDVSACSADMACVTLNNCLNACSATDTTCQNNCATTAGQTAVNEFNAIGTCICDDCTACVTEGDCSSGDAGPPPVTDSGTTVDSGRHDSGTTTQDSGSTASCDTCQTTATNTGGQCASEANTCDNDPDCSGLVMCLDNCTGTGQTCPNNCASQAGQSAVTEYNNVVNCLCMTACTSQCASECQ